MASRGVAGAVAAIGRALSVYGAGKRRQNEIDDQRKKITDANDQILEKSYRDEEAARLANERAIREHRRKVDESLSGAALNEEIPAVNARIKARGKAATQAEADSRRNALNMANANFRFGLWLKGAYQPKTEEERQFFHGKLGKSGPAMQGGAGTKKPADAKPDWVDQKLFEQYQKLQQIPSLAANAGDFTTWRQKQRAKLGLPDKPFMQIEDQGQGDDQSNDETGGKPSTDILTPDQSSSTGDSGLDYYNSIVRAPAPPAGVEAVSGESVTGQWDPEKEQAYELMKKRKFGRMLTPGEEAFVNNYLMKLYPQLWQQ